MRTWAQEPRLYDDGFGNNWWPHPSTFDPKTYTNDTSKADSLTGLLFGKRNDGEIISLCIALPPNATEDYKVWTIKQAEKKIATFLDERCQCARHRICDWHQLSQAAVIHEGDQIPQC